MAFFLLGNSSETKNIGICRKYRATCMPVNVITTRFNAQLLIQVSLLSHSTDYCSSTGNANTLVCAMLVVVTA